MKSVLLGSVMAAILLAMTGCQFPQAYPPCSGGQCGPTGYAPGYSQQPPYSPATAPYAAGAPAAAAPNYGTVPPANGTVPPNYGTVPPNYGTVPPNYGTVPPNYGTVPPNYAAPAAPSGFAPAGSGTR